MNQLFLLIIILANLLFQGCSTATTQLSQKESDLANLDEECGKSHFLARGTLLALGERAKNGKSIESNSEPLTLDEWKGALKTQVYQQGLKIGGIEATQEDLQEALTLWESGGGGRDLKILIVGLIKLPGEVYQDIPNGTKDLITGGLRMRGIKNFRQCREELGGITACLNPIGLLQENPFKEQVWLVTGNLLDIKTVRLGIILFARSHGFEVDHEDIHNVQNFFRAPNSNNPMATKNLAPLFEAGFEIMKKKYKVDKFEQALKLLRRMQGKGSAATCHLTTT